MSGIEARWGARLPQRQGPRGGTRLAGGRFCTTLNDVLLSVPAGNVSPGHRANRGGRWRKSAQRPNSLLPSAASRPRAHRPRLPRQGLTLGYPDARLAAHDCCAAAPASSPSRGGPPGGHSGERKCTFVSVWHAAACARLCLLVVSASGISLRACARSMRSKFGADLLRGRDLIRFSRASGPLSPSRATHQAKVFGRRCGRPTAPPCAL